MLPDILFEDSRVKNRAMRYTDQEIAALIDSAPEALNTLKELADVSGTINAQAPPIGSIIGLHPSIDVAKAIDAAYWKYCDGSGTFKFIYADLTESGDISVPQLTDSRFLMGGTALGTGGSNFLIDHTHASGNNSVDHTHTHDHASKASGNQSASHDHTISGGSHYHFVFRSGVASGDLSAVNFPYVGDSPSTYTIKGDSNTPNFGQSSPTTPIMTAGNQSASHTHNTDLASQVSTGVSADHNHVIGSGNVPTSTSNLPQYFKVKYFMRIK